MGAAGSGVEVGVYVRHRSSLPSGDSGAGPLGPDDVFRVAQLDERMITTGVAECLEVYGGTDGTVQVVGCGEQFLPIRRQSASPNCQAAQVFWVRIWTPTVRV